MKTIVLTRRWPAAAEALLAQHGKVLINEANIPFSVAQLKDAFSSADVVCCTVTDEITAEVIGEEPRARLIANFGVGFNHIDLDAARLKGIAVTNTPGVLTTATAEIAMALILMSARRASEGERLVRTQQWSGWHPTHMLSTQVSGKKLGIVGLGRIGSEVARQAHYGFGMQILYSGRNRAPLDLENKLGAQHVALKTLLQTSDFVSLHCPSTSRTHHLINRQALDAMQAHAFLINTARGNIVDEQALVDALRKGRIAGAGLDVYENEPLLAAGLTALDNVVLLPHMGSNTKETREAMGRCAAANVEAFLLGKNLPDPVF